MALVDAIPETIAAEIISGEGWKLISLRNNPPTVPVDINPGEVDVFSQLRQRFAPEQDVSVLNVQPTRLSLELEPMTSKKLPLVWGPTLSYAERYDRVGQGYFEPDSIWVSGAVSKVESLEAWVIDYTIELDNIRDDITLQLPIISPDPALIFDQNLVSYHETVTEYTEGELSLVLRLGNSLQTSALISPHLPLRFNIQYQSNNTAKLKKLGHSKPILIMKLFEITPLE